jgi:hypothetical protein
VRVVDELPGQLRQLGITLRERGQVGEPLTNSLGGGLGGPAAGEESERAPFGGVHEFDDLVDLRGAEAVAAGRRQVAGDVEDRLLAVVER